MPYQEQEQEQEQEQDTLSEDSPEPPAGLNGIPYDEIAKRYLEHCTSLPKLVKLTNQRKTAIRARWKDMPDLDGWADFFRRVEASDWIAGRIERKPPYQGWKATLDWLLKPDVFTRVLEGAHDNKGAASPQASPHTQAAGYKPRTRYEPQPDGTVLAIREEATA